MPIDQGELTWVSSEGGPLLLLAATYLSFWGGVIPPHDGRTVEAAFRWAGVNSPATDYDRACDVNDALGLVAVGAAYGLVLCEGVIPTGWRADAPTRGMLVQGGYGEGEAALLAALGNFPDEDWKATSLHITVESSPLYLFDAGLPGSNVVSSGDYLSLRLPPGRYSITSGRYEAEGSWVNLFRFNQTI